MDYRDAIWIPDILKTYTFNICRIGKKYNLFHPSVASIKSGSHCTSLKILYAYITNQEMIK